MKLELPAVVQTYVDSTNRHDIETVLSSFSEDAVVHDEARDYRGAKEIEDWVSTTIEKYKFQITPVSVSNKEVETLSPWTSPEHSPAAPSRWITAS